MYLSEISPWVDTEENQEQFLNFKNKLNPFNTLQIPPIQPKQATPISVRKLKRCVEAFCQNTTTKISAKLTHNSFTPKDFFNRIGSPKSLIKDRSLNNLVESDLSKEQESFRQIFIYKNLRHYSPTKLIKSNKSKTKTENINQRKTFKSLNKFSRHQKSLILPKIQLCDRQNKK